mmetsp:Transcript_69169/g.135977  ORF Transcript_69169/g.135977 Transcript_69169/m.135977 type:complete len:202 (-) Transcript_69169:546-1151(-)
MIAPPPGGFSPNEGSHTSALFRPRDLTQEEYIATLESRLLGLGQTRTISNSMVMEKGCSEELRRLGEATWEFELKERRELVQRGPLIESLADASLLNVDSTDINDDSIGLLQGVLGSNDMEDPFSKDSPAISKHYEYTDRVGSSSEENSVENIQPERSFYTLSGDVSNGSNSEESSIEDIGLETRQNSEDGVCGCTGCTMQ